MAPEEEDTRGNNAHTTWCPQIRDCDALCWHFDLAWVLFSFSQVHGSVSQHILEAFLQIN